MSFSSEEEMKERSDPESENSVLHPPLELSWEQPERERQRMKNLSLGSPSTPPPVGPGKPKYKLAIPEYTLDPKNPSYCIVSITEVDPENVPACYCPCTVKLASEGNMSTVDTEKVEVEVTPPRYYEFCSKCGTEHHPNCLCPALPCKTCFDPLHTSGDCPLFDHVPKGAFFDRANYEIICGCGDWFNEDKWVCVRCNGRPILKSKRCVFCSQYTQHSSYECPNNKVAAAKLKAIRDQAFSSKKIPYTG